MVARGDLGVEIGAGARAAAPEADHPRGARAREAGDHGDADARVDDPPAPSRRAPRRATSRTRSSTAPPRVMLSGETAVGEYPVEAVAYMDRIARAVEPSLGYRHELPEASDEPDGRPGDVERGLRPRRGAAARRRSSCPTFTGRTASAVARLRPRRPIIALTHHDYALRQMALEWGVTPLLIPECDDVEELWRRRVDGRARERARRRGRPRRDHRRHRRQPPRHDERDQGRRRRRRTRGTRGEVAPRGQAFPQASPRARATSLALGRGWARSCSSGSSTTARCAATSSAKHDLARAHGRRAGAEGREARPAAPARRGEHAARR